MSMLIMVTVLAANALAKVTSEPGLTSISEQRCSSNTQQTTQSSDFSSCNGLLPCSEMYADTCPPGLFCKEGHCECGVYPNNIISCNGTSSFALRNKCVTFDEIRNVTLAGSCDGIMNEFETDNILYYKLPRCVYHLNEMCKSYNRTGVLCGRCLPNHYLLAYSFHTNCIPCPHARWNWLRYIMTAYLPLTLFYILILFFKINTTSNHLFAVVYYCQALTMPVVLRNLLISMTKTSNPRYVKIIKVLCSINGVWNLDFGRPFYSDLCLGIGILPTLALDYAIAVYPLLLMIVTYLLIVLYDRNYRIITIMLTPFQILFSFFRRNWDLRTSVVDVFATFFLLSNTKFLSVSFDLLIPTHVYQLYEDHYNYTLGLYYAGDIVYFGKEHLPYAILAIVVLCVFVILPVLILALYPLAFFRKLLCIFPVRWYVLHTYIDSFYGCYKNGTQPGTRDYRWFVSVFFIVRLIQFVLYTMTNINIYFVLVTMTLILHTTLVAILQPFKSSHYNAINIVFLQLLTLFCVTMSDLYEAYPFYNIISIFGFIPAIIPLLYLIILLCHWAYTHRKFSFGIMYRLIAWRNGYSVFSEPSDMLPDRIENSGDYPRENLANFSSVPVATSN